MDSTLNKAKEEQIIAGIVYFSSIIPFIGMIIPFVCWIINRDKSDFLIFHSLQALLFQAILSITNICMFLLYFLSFFASFLIGFGTAAASGNQEPGPLFFISFLIPFVVFFLMFAFFFLFSAYGITAGVVIILKGDFKFIVLGKALEKYLLKPMSAPKNKPEHE